MTELSMSAEDEAILQGIASEMAKERVAPPAAPAWHQHSAFDEIAAARYKISRARDALAGIAAMLQPETNRFDEQMNMTRRSDASAVFDFFAEAMREPLDVVDEAANRLQIALRTGQP